MLAKLLVLSWWYLDFLFLFVILGLKSSDKFGLKDFKKERKACISVFFFFSFHGGSCANSKEATSSLFGFDLSGKYADSRPAQVRYPFPSIHLGAVIGTGPSNSRKSTGTVSKF